MDLNKWDLRFLKIAEEIASWSKDPSTKVGACIYDASGRPVSQGFNGLPQKMKDDDRILDREWKYVKILHAEENAILFANRDLDGCTIYTYPFMPCAHCASIIAQKRVARVVSFKHNVERWIANMQEARNTFSECGIELVEYPHEELEKRV